METPRPPHHQSPINVVIEGRLLAASPDKAPAPHPIPRWKFWRGPPETVLAISTVVLTVATLILALIAAIQVWVLSTTDAATRKAADAAVISASTAQNALKDARENFRSEQRPIIWLTSDQEGPIFLKTEQIAWNWHYTNYGKTPALHISYRSFMRIEKSTEANYDTQDHPLSGAPLPIGKVDFSTVVSRPGIDQSEFNRLLSSKDNVGISGTISYSDAYGAKYETTFCLMRLITGAIKYCKEGNDIRMVSAAQ